MPCGPYPNWSWFALGMKRYKKSNVKIFFIICSFQLTVLGTDILEEIQLKDYSSFVENSISPLGKLLKLCSTSILSEPIAYSPSAKDRLFLALSDFCSDILCDCWRFLSLNMDALSLRDHLLSSLIIVDVDESCSSFKKASEVLSKISKRDFPALTSQKLPGLNFVGLPGREVVDGIARGILLIGSEELTISLRKCSGWLSIKLDCRPIIFYLLDENICRSLFSRMCGVIKFLGKCTFLHFITPCRC